MFFYVESNIIVQDFIKKSVLTLYLSTLLIMCSVMILEIGYSLVLCTQLAYEHT